MVGYAIYLKKKKQNTEEWMKILLKSNFFDPCFDHQEMKKNEVNLFCIDCRKCLCQYCLSSSSPSLCEHKLIQIRRYVYHDVVRIQEMQNLIDCSKIQPYTLNSSKVIFLNPRPYSKSSKLFSGGACCKVCERILSDHNQYCSIACKVSPNLDNSYDSQNKVKCFSNPIPEFSKIHIDNEISDEKSGSNYEDDDSSSGYSSSKSGLLKPKKQLKKRKGIPIRAPLM